MEIAIALYDRFTALDCIGPYEVLSRVPAARVRFLSTEGGPVRSDTGMLTIQSEARLDQVPAPDMILVPGGPGDEAAAADPRMIRWLRHAHETTKWTTSVCTGSLVLAAAGLLKGLEATTHWASYDRLAALGAKPVARRFVRNGKIITAAGVSAGIDMALELLREEVNDDFSRAVQLAIEYDPAPPFDSGSPQKAPYHVVELVRMALADSTQRGAASAS